MGCRLRQECGVHVRMELESLQGQTPDCNAFLQLVDSKWQDHCSSMLTLRNIFLYLDRSFVLQKPSLRSIWDMGLELFRNQLQARQKKHGPMLMKCWSIVEEKEYAILYASRSLAARVVQPHDVYLRNGRCHTQDLHND